MLWDYAIWNMIDKSRSTFEKYSDGRLIINHYLHHSIDVWFFQSQMISTRRLIDKYSLEGNVGVYSLVNILKDMIENSNFLTRKNIFEMRKMTYDTKSLQDALSKWLDEHCKSGEAVGIPSKFNWFDSEDLHTLIDILSKTASDNRSPNDKIDVAFLEKIKGDLCYQCDAIKKIVDTTIAHAATEESRVSVHFDNIRLKVTDILKAQETFYKYANFLQMLLNGTSVGFLPIADPALFTDWDKPLYQGKNGTILKEIWDEYDKRTRSWGLGFDELINMMAGV